MLLELLNTNTALLATAAVVFLVIVLKSGKKYVNLPPGPRALPIVGHLWSMMRSQYNFKDLELFSRKYGPIMTIKLGHHDVFILSGYDIMKEALVDRHIEFSERPRWMNTIAEQARDKAGIFFHKDWHQRRRFILVSMRDFGLGKRSLEERMVEEAGFMVEEMAKANGQPKDLSLLLPCVTANIICTVIIGDRFQYGEEGFMKLLQSLASLVRGTTTLTVQNFIRFGKYIPTPDWKAQMAAFMHIQSVAVKWKNEHRVNFDQEDCRDLIDLFLTEQNKDEDKFQDKDLVMTIMELFVAGTETTSTTLLWALLFMMHNPEAQDKCRREIHDVIGKERPPVWADKKNTPYLTGFLNEVQRLGNILPLSLWHCAVQDTQLGGYTIPKGNVILLNMETALKDPKYWTDPHVFKPERWLDAEGKLVKNPAFMPFSIGKRACLGKQLAEKELYIFLTSMVQKFKFEMEDEKSPPSIMGISGTVHGPGEFKVRSIKV